MRMEAPVVPHWRPRPSKAAKTARWKTSVANMGFSDATRSSADAASSSYLDNVLDAALRAMASVSTYVAVVGEVMEEGSGDEGKGE